MTTEREAAGPEEARGAADHESGTSSQLLWERTAVVTEDVNGTFQVLPGAGGDLLGWSNADLQCAPYVDFVHPDDRDLLAEAGDAQRLSSAPTAFVPLDLRVLARDRRYWWTRWSVVATGRGVGAVGVDYLAPHPTKGPPVGTWRWDVDADTVSWSTELLDMFGFAVGPPVAYADFLSVVVDDDRDTVDHAVQRTLVDGGPYVVDFGIADASGREHWFHAAGRLLERPTGSSRHLGGLLKYLNPARRAHGPRRATGCG